MNAVRGLFARLEIDERLLGMLFCLIAIWVGFDLLSDGRFITPRNLYNLSLQTASVAIMAIGMVLIIIIRHIDLSVGSMLGVTAMIVGVVQTFWLPPVLGGGHSLIMPAAVITGIVVGAFLGGLNGFMVGYLGVPSFVVTLGGLLIWRGCAWWVTQGQTVAPLDETFTLLGGGVYGTIGETASWIVGIVAAIAIAYAAHRRRRRHVAYGFPVRPLWAEIAVVTVQAALPIGFAATLNAYEMPAVAAQKLAEMKGWEIPDGGLHIFMGIPIPVIILVGLAVLVSLILNKTRFGRYVFAMGGNLEAAERAGINVKRMTFWVFALMGGLVGISAIVASARLQSAGNSIGTLDELRVIAAAVIGGCSLAGGAGTISGAILGAVIIQSLQSGMSLLGYDASLQNIVTGAVLVIAVYVDRIYQQRRPAAQ